MKKILTFITTLFIFSSMVIAAPAAKKPVTAAKKPVAKKAAPKKIQTKHKIEFTTKDKFILVGDLYLSATKTEKPLVVLLHSFGMSASSWMTLAEKLRLRGYNVLAMDARGHSRSVYNEKLKVKSRFQFTDSDWKKLPIDVIESIEYVKHNYPKINCNDIIFVGADMGASSAVLTAGLLKKQPVKFVIISPVLNFKGLYIPVRIARYTTTKFMVLLSQSSDKAMFNFYSQTPPVIKQYPKGGAGYQLLRANPSALDDIVNFLN